MAVTFIPGWQAAVDVGGSDLTLIGNVVGYSDDQTAVPKATFGSKYRRTIGGQGVYTLELSGHLSAEDAAALWALRAADGPQSWTVQMGDPGEATDAGIIGGSAIVTNLSFDDDAEGNWAWSLSLEGDGTPTYTPATPPT